ncbi:hypothetical protein ILUMI_24820 [Ignelater luminosus]|uniref:Uncharacterized protein n=1 Tax=Ignelater luminosus TaxID=2038154 RepID=A0A8K0C9S0_IGNLU|nr:hypothetical protein ILUMI_24820 [Ignelater luminosus]
MEQLQEKHDTFNLHRKVTELTGKIKTIEIPYLLDENNSIISDIEEKMNLWKDYIESLFEDNREEKKIEEQKEETRPDITKTEI